MAEPVEVDQELVDAVDAVPLPPIMVAANPGAVGVFEVCHFLLETLGLQGRHDELCHMQHSSPDEVREAAEMMGSDYGGVAACCESILAGVCAWMREHSVKRVSTYCPSAFYGAWCHFVVAVDLEEHSNAAGMNIHSVQEF